MTQAGFFGSINIQHILSYIFIFITSSNVCNYADDYKMIKSLAKLYNYEWFYENRIVVNPGKSHSMLIGNQN